MERSERLRRKIEEFVEQLTEEFGNVSAGENGCLLEAVEDWAVEVGDQVARKVMTKQVTAECPPVDEAECAKCHQMGRWKGRRKRRVETGPLWFGFSSATCSQRCCSGSSSLATALWCSQQRSSLRNERGTHRTT